MSKPETKTKLIIASLAIAVMPFFAQAGGLVPCGGPTEKPCTVLDAFVLVAKVTNWLIAMAGIYAVYEIVRAGFWLAISMGNEESITKNKAGISQAVVGFVLVLMAFMFINTIVNFMLTRNVAINGHPECQLDLTNPTNYLLIKQNPCSNLPDNLIH